MVDTLVQARNFNTTPVDTDLRTVPDGALVTGDWKQAYVARGQGWHVDIGDLTTPVAGAGESLIIDIDRPNFVASVPLGWVLRPIRMHVQLETPLSAGDLDEVESLIAVDRKQVNGGAAANGTVFSPFNMRTDIIAGCPIDVVITASGNMTAPTLGMELSRKVIVLDEVGTPASALWGSHDHLYEPKNPPFIVGPAALYIYWGGTVATSGYAQVDFIAFPAAKVTNLV